MQSSGAVAGAADMGSCDCTGSPSALSWPWKVQATNRQELTMLACRLESRFSTYAGARCRIDEQV
uniref:Uncharacterized protein n=1 Tax=Arundo donax TaxID=35708 RepID=A0A0A9G2S4_ARUDO